MIKAVFCLVQPTVVQTALLEQRQSDKRKKMSNRVAWSKNSTQLTVVRTNDN